MRYLERLSQYLVFLGVPGVFVLSLLDSGGVPMFGGPDAVILLLAWHNPAQAVAVALSAATGSLLGCLVLYRIGRTGGNFALRGVSPQKREKIFRIVDRHAGLACFFAVMSPPPLPTKPILLAAGALGAPLGAFSAAVIAGRLLRYSVVAWLGAHFGSEAAAVMKRHYPVAIGAMLTAGAAWLLITWVKTRRAPARAVAPSAAVNRSADLP